MASESWSYAPGQIVELSESQASAWVGSRLADWAEGETASLSPAETAARKPAPRRKGAK
ncbi:hypothetical protein [Marininema mesophilum]|uniref:hypothetical protein n=1 Tax=Marininema mesophilum TaxID=1048340 RepID=UPI0015A5EB67|nr:hypothetical protein [Marininema mesophilum]